MVETMMSKADVLVVVTVEATVTVTVVVDLTARSLLDWDLCEQGRWRRVQSLWQRRRWPLRRRPLSAATECSSLVNTVLLEAERSEPRGRGCKRILRYGCDVTGLQEGAGRAPSSCLE